MVFSNVLNNANEDVGGQGRTRAADGRVDDGVEVTVENTGCTLTEDEAQHGCERFWRADALRRDTGVHCGL